MPYGLPKSVGGESQGNVAWMDRCVKRVQATGKEKGSAIAICKAELIRHHGTTKAIADGLVHLKGAKSK